MKFKKILAFVLTTCMVSMSFSPVVQISAQITEDISSHVQVITSGDRSLQTFDSSLTGNNQTDRDAPNHQIFINDKEDFSLFMNSPGLWTSDHLITLTHDIDIEGEEYTPIEEFGGIFDGNGHTISNLLIKGSKYVISANRMELAFIKTLDSFAEIKNVTFDKYIIMDNSVNYISQLKSNHLAGLVLTNHGTISKVNFKNTKITIYRSHAFNNYIYSDYISSGFVMNNENDGIIEDCSIVNAGSASGAFEKLNLNSSDMNSGFVYENNGDIKNCSTSYDCSIKVYNQEALFGGFVSKNNGSIKKCISEGTVYGSRSSKNKLEADFTKLDLNNNAFTKCGGFVGENSGTIEECEAKGNADSSSDNSREDYIGGFCGDNKGEISSCKSSGSATVSNQSFSITKVRCGGFVGGNSGTLKNCTSAGVVGNLKPAAINVAMQIVLPVVFSLLTYGLSLVLGCLEFLGNLGVAKSTNPYEYIGGFCGDNSGEILESKYEGNVIAVAKIHTIRCGGFVGKNSGNIKECSSKGSVAGQECVGGFCGDNSGKILKSKSESHAIAATKSNTVRCGGFVGENSGSLKDCNSTGNATGQEYVGGFAGTNTSDITYCYATGIAIAKTKTHTALAGGFIGENSGGKISNCTASGGADSQSKSGQAKAGGFVGINKASILNSKASGKVYLSSGIFRTDDGCGGFVGKNDKNGSICGCYAEATVQTTHKKKGGGFVGEAKKDSVIKNSSCKSKIVTKSGIKTQTKFCEDKNKKAVIQNCK